MGKKKREFECAHERVIRLGDHELIRQYIRRLDPQETAEQLNDALKAYSERRCVIARATRRAPHGSERRALLEGAMFRINHECNLLAYAYGCAVFNA